MSVEAFDFPASRGGCPFAPPAALAELSRDTPVGRIILRDGSQPWLVTRHADVRALLRDERFSSSSDHPNFPFINEGLKAQTMDAASATLRTVRRRRAHPVSECTRRRFHAAPGRGVASAGPKGGR